MEILSLQPASNPITTKTWVVLWSPHQKCFHIEPLGKMLETNIRIYLRDKLGDYTLLAFADTHEDADNIIRRFETAKAGRPIAPVSKEDTDEEDEQY